MYWKPEPKRHGFAWWALLIPAIIYSIGVIVYAHNAFVPGLVAENGHAIGSALMVLGGESGTLAAAAEVFRKAREGETIPFDWAGLFVSLAATLGNLMVVYVSLAVHLDAPWVEPVRRWGPLMLLLCSGIDFYAGIMEFGFYNASFDARWTAWNDARHSWEAAQVTRRLSVKSEPADVKPEFTPQPVDAETELDELAMQIYTLYTESPDITKSALAKATGVSRPTVNARLEVLKAAGKI
jgi:hypothetical protein